MKGFNEIQFVGKAFERGHDGMKSECENRNLKAISMCLYFGVKASRIVKKVKKHGGLWYG